MKGSEFKQILKTTGKSFVEIGEAVGMTPQLLNSIFTAKDVKTGTIEKFAHDLHLPISFFYPAQHTSQTTITNSTVGNNSTHGGDSGVMGAALVAQLEKKDEQINRLLKIIETISK